MPTTKLTKEEERQTIWSLFLGPVIWFLHLNILNILTSVSCKWGWLNFSIAGLPGLRFVEMIISLVMLVLMLYMVFLAWRNWLEFQTERPIHNPNLLHDTEKNRSALLAFVALLMNTIFSVFILASFVLLFALKACGGH
jgi:hypothetical protein